MIYNGEIFYNIKTVHWYVTFVTHDLYCVLMTCLECAAIVNIISSKSAKYVQGQSIKTTHTCNSSFNYKNVKIIPCL